MGLFLSQLDYGDIVCRFACPTALSKLDLLCHAALRYISDSAHRTHHRILYNLVGWSSLTTCRMQHRYVFVYEALLGHIPSYICSKFIFATGSHNLRDTAWFHLTVPFVWTDFGKRSLNYFDPWFWNDLESHLKMASFIS